MARPAEAVTTQAPQAEGAVAVNLKVLLISGSYPPMPCGVGGYTASLASALAARPGLQVGVLTGRDAATRGAEGGVQVLPAIGDWGVGSLPLVVRSALEWSPQIIHVQYPTQGYGKHIMPWLLPAIFRLRGIPVVQTWHEFMPPQRWLRFIIGKAASHVVIVRHNYLEFLTPWFRGLISKSRIELIPNAAQIAPPQLTQNEVQAERARYAPESKKLIVHFGFMYPHKGVEQLFEIADPGVHHLVLAGQMDDADPYHRQLRALAAEARWQRAVTLTGFLADRDLARLISCADAVVFPFREGEGPWNTSVSSTMALGTFVVTTSASKQGYDVEKNVFYCAPGRIAEMRKALREYAGNRRPPSSARMVAEWSSIATAHEALYRSAAGSMHG